MTFDGRSIPDLKGKGRHARWPHKTFAAASDHALYRLVVEERLYQRVGEDQVRRAKPLTLTSALENVANALGEEADEDRMKKAYYRGKRNRTSYCEHPLFPTWGVDLIGTRKRKKDPRE